MRKLHWTGYLIWVVILGCNQLSGYSAGDKVYTSKKEEEAILCSPASGLLGKTGMKAKPSPQKIASFENGLQVVVDGFTIVPLAGLRSWAAFTDKPDSAMVTGDIIAPGSYLASVQKEVDAQGLTIRDIHEYPARNGAVILFMHVTGFGSNAGLSRSANALFENLQKFGNNNPRETKSNTVTDLNRSRLDSIIGYQGENTRDIYKYAIGRPGVLGARGMPEKRFSEFTTWAAWQGTDEDAVVAGDFAMLENEVGPVIKTLAENGIELIHNQRVHANPDIYCLHYWGAGNAEKLAKGLKSALELQEK